MKLIKQCKTCEFNFNGICADGSGVYKYGEEIVDDTVECDSWGVNLEYFGELTTQAPRFLREQLASCRIYYNEFEASLEAIGNGEPVEINVFDAIKTVYGISMVDIAVLLDVSFGVVYRAKTKGFAAKRVNQFADALCIPKELLAKTTTLDLDKLRECKEIFGKTSNLDLRLKQMPQWKERLAHEISSMYLRCPINIAKEISRVDKLHWSPNISLDEYTESEKVLINYINRNIKKGKIVNEVEYSLDLACKPHIRVLSYEK